MSRPLLWAVGTLPIFTLISWLISSVRFRLPARSKRVSQMDDAVDEILAALFEFLVHERRCFRGELQTC